MATEELQYMVITKYGDVEIRQYAPHIVAETTVKGRFDWVGNVAFQRLAGYIFGKNRRSDSIAMTAPVFQGPVSEKIAMTSPVLQTPDTGGITSDAQSGTASGNSWVVTFVMPAKYTMDSLPEPTNTNVRLSERPGHLMAALTYSGSWRKSTFEKKKTLLETHLREHNYLAVGPAVFARYDPPMTLWFRRRNEVLIPVQLANDNN